MFGKYTKYLVGYKNMCVSNIVCPCLDIQCLKKPSLVKVCVFKTLYVFFVHTMFENAITVKNMCVIKHCITHCMSSFAHKMLENLES